MSKYKTQHYLFPLDGALSSPTIVYRCGQVRTVINLEYAIHILYKNFMVLGDTSIFTVLTGSSFDKNSSFSQHNFTNSVRPS